MWKWIWCLWEVVVSSFSDLDSQVSLCSDLWGDLELTWRVWGSLAPVASSELLSSSSTALLVLLKLHAICQ